MKWALALVAFALVGVAAISRRLSGTPVTRAMVFACRRRAGHPNGMRQRSGLPRMLAA